MKNTKTTLILYITAILFLVTASSAFAGRGMGVMDGTGPVHNITDGVPVNIEGMVTAIGTPGTGMTVDTGDELVTIFGIGPVRFWEEQGVERPAVGEEVTVDGYEVTLSDGSTRIIATEITVGGETIVLRDADTGAPAWRKGGCQNCMNSQGMKGSGMHGTGQRDRSCLR